MVNQTTALSCPHSHLFFYLLILHLQLLFIGTTFLHSFNFLKLLCLMLTREPQTDCPNMLVTKSGWIRTGWITQNKSQIGINTHDQLLFTGYIQVLFYLEAGYQFLFYYDMPCKIFFKKHYI